MRIEYKITVNDVEEFAPDDETRLEIITDMINGDYTSEALRQDYFESVIREPEGE